MGQRTAKKPARLESLFETLREGFVLCEMVRDSEGRAIDYRISEANPAFLRGLGGAAAVGKTLLELRPEVSQAWFDTVDKVLKEKKPKRMEYWDRAAGRWYDAYMTPVSADELAMFYVDVTRRKDAEARQVDLFRELNHRVKNNFHVVSAMLTLQAKNAEPAVQRALTQAVARIHAIAEVHSILYRTGSMDEVGFDAYLADLCARLSTSMGDGRIKIRVKAEPVRVSIDRAVEFGIIVNELVTNAVKHAYRGALSGEIDVDFRHADHGLELTVRDHGPGLPPNDQGRGLGMKLVRSLVQQCGGVLVLEPGPGAHLCVRIPHESAVENEQQLL